MASEELPIGAEAIKGVAYLILLAECGGSRTTAKIRWSDNEEAPHYLKVAEAAIRAADEARGMTVEYMTDRGQRYCQWVSDWMPVEQDR